MSISPAPAIVARSTAIAPPDTEANVAVPPVASSRRPDLFLDLFERCLVGGFFLWLVARLVLDYLNEGRLGSLLLIPSEGLVVVFMVIRRFSQHMSRRPGEWLIALAATCVPMLVAPQSDYTLVPAAGGAVLLLAGIIVQVHAKLTLGRSLGCVPAHRGLRLAGPYRFVRHPMYLGYLMSHLAFLSLNPSFWNLGVYCVCYALQVPRIILEERLLGEDPCYREYQSRVPFRLIPGVF
jgi:protein-S-isoprenylcysteine O-methyltransferase Ste14